MESYVEGEIPIAEIFLTLTQNIFWNRVEHKNLFITFDSITDIPSNQIWSNSFQWCRKSGISICIESNFLPSAVIVFLLQLSWL